ncbi:MAG: carboxymuconolactone decarboxylase family protein [Thermoplasmata archaeon]|nr:carboxymuconolactone decarboxylase family protein [Thermoplasmata archaeon]
MPARIDYEVVAPDATKGLAELVRFVRSGILPQPLLELVMLRASQMNGCAYCLDLHFRRARRAQVPQAQLDTLDAWTESPAFSDRERAALAWTESLTRIAPDHAPDAVWEQVRSQFSEREVVELSIAIVEINSWNRLMIGFRTPPTFGVSSKTPTEPRAVPTVGGA